MSDRRTHFKLQELPEDIQRTADRMIAEGKTYRDIATWLDGQGFEVSKSSVARYGATFLASLERLKVVGEQVKAILADTDGSDTQAEEAASRVATAKIVDYMLNAEDLADEKFSSMVHALARLQSTSVARERLRIQTEGMMKGASAELKEELRNELGEHPELAARLETILEERLEKAVVA